MAFGKRGTSTPPAPTAFQRRELAGSPHFSRQSHPLILGLAAIAAFFAVVCVSLVLARHPHTVPPASTLAPAADQTAEIAARFARFPDTTVAYYDVTGDTAQSIRAALNAAGPLDAHEHRAYDANTAWHVAWRWPGNGAGGCALGDTTVGFRAVVTLPRLASGARLDPDLARRWRAYMTALSTHEAGHVAHAYEHLEDVRRAVAAATCETANAAGAAAVHTLNQYDIDYDAETGHGATQGAVFP